MSSTIEDFRPAAIPNGMADFAHAYGGVWAITPEHAFMLSRVARKMDLHAHLAAAASERDQKRASKAAKAAQAAFDDDDDEDGDEPEPDPYELTGEGIAVIEARGVLMKFVPSLSRGTSTVKLRRSIRLAVNDARVNGIMLIIESPGGSVAGLPDLGDEIAAANKKKPVWAYAEDLMASAAYWLGSQCSRIGANRTAMVGSCGTIYVDWDMSKMFEEAGVEVVVYQSGDLKGAGTEGTKITPKQREYFQALIDETNSHFVDAVDKGRPQANTKRLFREAAIYVAAPKGLELGVVDEISSYETFYTRFVASVGRPVPARGTVAESDQIELVAAVDDAATPPETIVESTPAAAGEGVDMSTTQTAGATPGAAGGAQPANTQATTQTTADAGAVGTIKAAGSWAQLKAACPGASNDFLATQMEAGATAEQAGQAYMAHLLAESNALKTAAAAAAVKPAASASPAKRPGTAAVGSVAAEQKAESGDAFGEFKALVAEKRKSGMSAGDAVEAAAIERPDLHERVVA